MQGLLFIVTAPSGAGKSSLVNVLLADDPALALSISYTTRAPRPGEVNGREYHFVSEGAFEEHRAAGGFLESANVYGHRYGTSRAELLRAETEGVDLMIAGSRGYGPYQAVLLGCVSGRLVRDASCPVLVVPRGIEAPLEDLFQIAPGAVA